MRKLTLEQVDDLLRTCASHHEVDRALTDDSEELTGKFGVLYAVLTQLRDALTPKGVVITNEQLPLLWWDSFNDEFITSAGIARLAEAGGNVLVALWALPYWGTEVQVRVRDCAQRASIGQPWPRAEKTEKHEVLRRIAQRGLMTLGQKLWADQTHAKAVELGVFRAPVDNGRIATGDEVAAAIAAKASAARAQVPMPEESTPCPIPDCPARGRIHYHRVNRRWRIEERWDAPNCMRVEEVWDLEVKEGP